MEIDVIKITEPHIYALAFAGVLSILIGGITRMAEAITQSIYTLTHTTHTHTIWMVAGKYIHHGEIRSELL